MLQEEDDSVLINQLHLWLAEEASYGEGDCAFPPGPKALGEQLYGKLE